MNEIRRMQQLAGIKLNELGTVIPALKKQEVIDKLRENLTEPGTWSII